jgi:XRE family aerobic/anaerobic benzoate catabolism transcriptional regulator
LVTASETFALLRQRAFTVWLRARPEDHWTRVVAQGDTRPMADDDRAFQNLGTILAEREPLYGQADVVVDTTGRDVDAIAFDLALRFAFVAGGPLPHPPADPSGHGQRARAH